MQHPGALPYDAAASVAQNARDRAEVLYRGGAAAVASAPFDRHGQVVGVEPRRTHRHRHDRGGCFLAACPLLLACAVSIALSLVVPLVFVVARRAQVSDPEMAADQQALLHMHGFRDLLWDMLSRWHRYLERDHTGYVICVSFLYMFNAVLWYLWYPFRVLAHGAWHLAFKSVLLTAVSIVLNTVTWFPPPAGYVQHEALFVNWALGFVVKTAHVFFAPRLAWSGMLLWDVLRTYGHKQVDEPGWAMFLTGTLILYAAFVGLFLLAAHHLYSITLAFNIVAAVGTWLAAAPLISWMVAVGHRCGCLPAPSRGRRASTEQQETSPMFTVVDDPEDEVDVTQAHGRATALLEYKHQAVTDDEDEDADDETVEFHS